MSPRLQSNRESASRSNRFSAATNTRKRSLRSSPDFGLPLRPQSSEPRRSPLHFRFMLASKLCRAAVPIRAPYLLTARTRRVPRAFSAVAALNCIWSADSPLPENAHGFPISPDFADLPRRPRYAQARIVPDRYHTPSVIHLWNQPLGPFTTLADWFFRLLALPAAFLAGTSVLPFLGQVPIFTQYVFPIGLLSGLLYTACVTQFVKEAQGKCRPCRTH